MLVYTETKVSNDPDPPAAEFTVLWLDNLIKALIV